MKRPRGLFVLDASTRDMIYGPQEMHDISALVDLIAPPLTKQELAGQMSVLRDVELLFSGWGAPLFDSAFLQAAPQLRAIFYGAGAMGSILTPAVWDRQIVVTSAIEANAVPVAEYALATILFSLKHGWSLSRRTHETREYPDRNQAPGCFGTVVGLISLGVVARKLLQLLRPLDMRVLLYDPFVSDIQAIELGVEKVSLDDLFERSDVVSLHTPLLPETEGMITGQHFKRMKRDATFINTARGQIVREEEMIDVLQDRPDLNAVLDVLTEEPPAQDSRIYNLKNVVLTPHIAGSVGTECRRMGQYMVAELRRYLRSEPLQYQVTPDASIHNSHRPMAMSPKVSVKVAPHLVERSGKMPTTVRST